MQAWAGSRKAPISKLGQPFVSKLYAAKLIKQVDISALNNQFNLPKIAKGWIINDLPVLKERGEIPFIWLCRIKKREIFT